MLLSSLLLVAALALYFMNGAERARLAAALRVPHLNAVATPTLVVVHTVTFLAVLAAPGPLSDPQTLVALGGNLAPKTTNGEWGRLVTSIFLHAGFIAFVVNMLALVTVGIVLERLVGPLTVLGVYIGAGILGGLVSLSASMTTVTVGASPSVAALYGLFLALWAHGVVQRATTTVRLDMARRLVPIAVIFLAVSRFDSSVVAAAECTGVVAGFVAGLVLGQFVPAGRPPARKVGLTLANAAAIAVIFAVPLRGIADVKPALHQVLDVEARMTRQYNEAVARFTQGRLTAKALAKLIDEQVTPEISPTASRLATLDKIPPEHRRLVAAAQRYLWLRQQSWAIRATALRTGNTAMLRTADRTEQDSLAALAIVRSGA